MSMDFASDVLAWDQAPQWGKKANNKNRKNIEEQSEPHGGLGRGKWQQSLETCLWCCHSMIPDSGIMLWLVKCLHVDRFAVRLTVLRSFNVTLLLFRQKIFSNTNFEQAIQISLQEFSLIPAPRRVEYKLYQWQYFVSYVNEHYDMNCELEESPWESIQLFPVFLRPVTHVTFSSETSLFLYTEVGVSPVGNWSSVDLFACTLISSQIHIFFFFYKSDIISSCWHLWCKLDALAFQWKVR